MKDESKIIVDVYSEDKKWLTTSEITLGDFNGLAEKEITVKEYHIRCGLEEYTNTSKILSPSLISNPDEPLRGQIRLKEPYWNPDVKIYEGW